MPVGSLLYDESVLQFPADKTTATSFILIRNQYTSRRNKWEDSTSLVGTIQKSRSENGFSILKILKNHVSQMEMKSQHFKFSWNEMTEILFWGNWNISILTIFSYIKKANFKPKCHYETRKLNLCILKVSKWNCQNDTIS